MIPYRMNPLGISVNEILPLTFTALSAGSTVTLNANGSPTVSGLHYRLGKSGTWLSYTPGSTITLAAVGDSAQFWNSESALSNSSSNYVQFAMTGQIAAKGNIQSLLNWSESCPNYCFYQMFYNCGPLVSAPDLPAMQLGDYCYSGMFRATSITALPDLPAKTLKFACYNLLAYQCQNMVSAPMIAGITPATSCMANAFNGSGITAAHIRLQTLTDYALTLTFSGCSALNRIEVDFTSWGNIATATQNWVQNVAESGTFIKPAALPEEYGVDRIPTGWTVVNK